MTCITQSYSFISNF